MYQNASLLTSLQLRAASEVAEQPWSLEELRDPSEGLARQRGKGEHRAPEDETLRTMALLVSVDPEMEAQRGGRVILLNLDRPELEAAAWFPERPEPQAASQELLPGAVSCGDPGEGLKFRFQDFLVLAPSGAVCSAVGGASPHCVHCPSWP